VASDGSLAWSAEAGAQEQGEAVVSMHEKKRNYRSLPLPGHARRYGLWPTWGDGHRQRGEHIHHCNWWFGGCTWDRVTGANGHAILGHWPMRRPGQQFPSSITKTVQTLKIKNTALPRSKNVQHLHGARFGHDE
jgi:hypothetical protein